MKKILFSALAILVIISSLSISVFAEGPQTFDVATASDLTDAISTIKSSDDSEFTINLTADVADSLTLNVNKTVTIIGNGHTLTCRINVSNGAVINLGDGTSELTVTKGNDSDPGVLYIQNGGTVNMSDKVTIKDHRSNNYFGGGVTIKSGTFNMNGGTIKNCGINGGSVCFGGGVAVTAGGTFNMNGGSIEDCYATTTYHESNPGLICAGAGGGVFVGGGSTFNMTGGEIKNCTASESGGGVFVVASKDTYFAHSAFGYLDSEFNMTGGSITGNTAAYYGGGVAINGYYINAAPIATLPTAAGTPANPGVAITGGSITDNTASAGAGLFAIQLKTDTTVGDGVNLCNNVATDGGSDVYVQACKIALPDAATMTDTYRQTTPAELTGLAIGAWYEDYDDDTRFTEQAEDARVIEEGYALLNATGSYQLVAAPTHVPYEYITEVEITKSYDQSAAYGTAVDLPTVGVLSETITYTVDAYSSFNREVGKTDIPAITPADITVGDGTDSATVTLPDFNPAQYGVGDYWYKVTEVAGTTAGVTYDDTVYYLHIVVANEDNGVIGPVCVTLHKTAPDVDGTYINDASDKTDGFDNKYDAGSLSVTKKLEGNMTDAEKAFEITVVFTAPAGKTVTGPINYTGAATGTVEGNWTTSKTVVLNLKGDETVTFTNIPDGVTYTVVESDYTDDGYTVAYTNDSAATETGDTTTDDGAAGSISDASDKVTVTNTKNATIDVGVILDNAPYIVIMVDTVAFAVVLAVTKIRRKKEEE